VSVGVPEHASSGRAALLLSHPMTTSNGIKRRCTLLIALALPEGRDITRLGLGCEVIVLVLEANVHATCRIRRSLLNGQLVLTGGRGNSQESEKGDNKLHLSFFFFFFSVGGGVLQLHGFLEQECA